MAETVTYEQGHLVAAAIRVLENRMGHPPTEEEIAELIGLSREWVGVLVAELDRLGILMAVDNAFTRRVEIRNHLALEDLTLEKDTVSLNQEMADFTEKRRAEEERLGEIFSGGDLQGRQKKRMNEMAKGLKVFGSDKPKASHLFPDDPDFS